MTDPARPAPLATPKNRPWVLIALISLCTAVELVLQLADHQIIASQRLRSIAYEYGGFWVGLLQSWAPNYPSQPYLMFATYGFLHGGPFRWL